MKDCLEQHRQEDDFSAECRDELESMMAERATDVRLDSSLRSACEEDIMRTCGWQEVCPPASSPATAEPGQAYFTVQLMLYHQSLDCEICVKHVDM